MTEHGRKVAIVTGGGTGVGAAAAQWLAGRGYDVLVNFSRSAGPAEEVAEACRAAGADALALAGDVAQDEDCRKLARAAEARWGRIDALVNSAGTTRFVPMSDLEALTADDFQRVYAVNAVGSFQTSRAVAPVMARTGGAIVNVSSIGGVAGTGSSYAYAASKGALNTLTLALARNLAPAIRVNAVLPGMVTGRWLKGGLGEEAYERVKAKFESDAALGRVSTPEDIADVIGWLVTGASTVTGQLITVDAGIGLGKPPIVTR